VYTVGRLNQALNYSAQAGQMDAGKSEIRNPKSEGIPKAEIRKNSAGRVSRPEFGLRISDLPNVSTILRRFSCRASVLLQVWRETGRARTQRSVI
jgi:hypothetical protein